MMGKILCVFLEMLVSFRDSSKRNVPSQEANDSYILRLPIG